MARTVLIVIDCSYRELFGCSLLARYLVSMGIKPILCSRFMFREYYLRYAPEAVVWPNAYYDLSDIAERSHIFILPTESGNGQASQVRVIHGGVPTDPVYPDYVDRFFCWGPAMREILLDTGKWRDEQLVVTGSPFTDHWLLPRPVAKLTKPRIGLTTAFRALRAVDLFQWLDQVETLGEDAFWFLPPEHAESWVFFEASVARVMVALVRKLAVEQGEKLEIRLHPFERETKYAYFRTLADGRVSLTKKATISEWLDNISIEFTLLSASAIDAVVRGVPVVSLRGLVDGDALRKIPRHLHYSYDDMMWQMEDSSQAVKYVQLAAKGDLKPCRDEKGFYEFLAQHFFYPRGYPAAQQMALEIKEVLDRGGGRNQNPRKIYFLQHWRAIWNMPRRDRSMFDYLLTPLRYLVRGWRSIKLITGLCACVYMPLFLYLVALCRYLNGLRPGRKDIGFSYRPWRIPERRVAMRAADRVLSSISGQRGQSPETVISRSS